MSELATEIGQATTHLRKAVELVEAELKMVDQTVQEVKDPASVASVGEQSV